ncbi:hypothetical protein ACIA74_38785 [Streptomyces sp. NPDC051658]|nr:hypothetical protein OG520_42785 [Streptomyces sp. NBC_00984]
MAEERDQRPHVDLRSFAAGVRKGQLTTLIRHFMSDRDHPSE